MIKETQHVVCSHLHFHSETTGISHCVLEEKYKLVLRKKVEQPLRFLISTTEAKENSVTALYFPVKNGLATGQNDVFNAKEIIPQFNLYNI